MPDEHGLGRESWQARRQLRSRSASDTTTENAAPQATANRSNKQIGFLSPARSAGGARVASHSCPGGREPAKSGSRPARGQLERLKRRTQWRPHELRRRHEAGAELAAGRMQTHLAWCGAPAAGWLAARRRERESGQGASAAGGGRARLRPDWLAGCAWRQRRSLFVWRPKRAARGARARENKCTGAKTRAAPATLRSEAEFVH